MRGASKVCVGPANLMTYKPMTLCSERRIICHRTYMYRSYPQIMVCDKGNPYTYNAIIITNYIKLVEITNFHYLA